MRNVGDMEIYFLRHGETEWNRDRRIQGSTEWTDLTDEGVRLAEAARDGMIAKGLAFDRLFSSPYRRALHTAQILGAGLGLAPIVDDRLREISFGPYEGTRYGEGLFADDNIRACFLDPPRYVARDGAEPFDVVLARVRAFIEQTLVPLAASCARVLVVAHGGILRTVLRLTANLPLSDFWKGPQPNCCAHVVTLAEGKLTLKARAVVF
jgi:broad specificity phosphatase PhoE